MIIKKKGYFCSVYLYKYTSIVLEMRPLVSFIITYYNEPTEYLRQAVESILQLSLQAKEREIIIIDDGSKECPLSALDDIQDEITYLRQKNAGLSMARNRGIQIAEGQFLQFVDADDALIPSVYEHCLDIVRYQNPDLVLFNFTEKEGYVMKVTTAKTEGPIDGSVWMKNNNVRAAACTYIFKKDILLNLRFEKGLIQEDEAFTPQLILRAEHLYHTDAKAYFYRQREGSIQHTKDEKHTQKSLNDVEKIIFQLQDVAASQSHTNRHALERRVNQLTMDYLYNIIKKTHNISELENRIERLRDRGLFPLPDKKYTWKYTYFRKCINTKVGRIILCKTL